MDYKYEQLFKKGWYLLYTRLSLEVDAAACIASEGIDYFLPLIELAGKGHVKRKATKTPLFPSCIFVNITSDEDYNRLELCAMLRCCLLQGRKPVWLDGQLVDRVRAAVSKAGRIYVSAQYFQPGEQIVFEEGSLSGVSGELIQCNGKKKILVRVDVINRCILIDLPAEYEPALAGIAC